MTRICIVTATRAEFGLLLPVIKGLNKSNLIQTQIVVTGAHLVNEFGMTVDEIVSEGIEIDRKIDILMNSDSPASISKTMGIAMISFADYFAEAKPDAVLILGDRYEMLAVACAAFNAKIPIIHMFGGDTTEGAIDEAVRHAITKMSYIHFTATEKCRKRVIQLGEDPGRVFCVGTTGVENVLNNAFLTKRELEEQCGQFFAKPYAIATFHPVTLENNTGEEQIRELVDAVLLHPNVNFVFTKANADAGGKRINQILEESQKNVKNLFLVDSLGMRRYLSAIKYAEFVIGNSSSGIAEAPILGIPTVNIGDRQKGRELSASVVCCEPVARDISGAIDIVTSSKFKSNLKNKTSIYGDGHTSERIVRILEAELNGKPLGLKKSFYDVEFDI